MLIDFNLQCFRVLSAFSNEFNRTVAEEYLKYFDFKDDTLEQALRKFLRQFSLTGETQERERVLVHFSRRYLDCNPGSFNSQGKLNRLSCKHYDNAGKGSDVQNAEWSFDDEPSVIKYYPKILFHSTFLSNCLYLPIYVSI